MMGPLTFVSLVIVVVAYVHGSDFAKGTGCYDCNYAPSGYVKGYKYWTDGVAEVGYMRCALTSPADPYFIRKKRCESGRCYIRREENGMVYRGCADTENLPWDVNAEVNCKYQGPSKSLWWFCDGHACNDGQLAETEERCGAPPPAITDDSTGNDEVGSEVQDDPTNYQEPALYEDGHGVNHALGAYGDHGVNHALGAYGDHGVNHALGAYGDHGVYHNAHGDSGNYGDQDGYDNLGRYGHHGGYGYGYQGRYGNQGRYYNYDGYGDHGNYGGYGYNLGNRNVDKAGLHLSQQQYYNRYPLQAPDTVAYAEPAAVKEAAIAHKEYNPCDGSCEYNPSGLFPDPARSNHFIQCGCDFKYGRPCTCCKKFYMPCAPNSYFDDHEKTCKHPDKSD